MTRIWGKAVAVLAVAAIVTTGAACSGSSSSGGGVGSAGGGTATTAASPRANEAAYRDKGPYVAGATTLDLDGRKIEVWYPADPGAEAGKTKVVFEIRDLLPDQLKALVPDDLNPKYPTDAYRDLTVSSKGPFPLVLFAHGFAGYPTEYQYLLTHLASWGFVVAAPDFKERGLLAALTGSTARADETAVMEQTRTLMETENGRAGGTLQGAVDTSRVGTVGHSAGVAPALGAAAVDPNVKTFVAMSGGVFRGGEGTTGTTLPPPNIPQKPGMVVTGGKDQIAAFASVKGLYDAMVPTKRLVVVDEAGHNSFDDLCVIGADQGGLLEIAKKVGINPPEQITGLFNDGCTKEFLEARQVWPTARHFVTAQLRYYLGVDPEPIGLGVGVADAFAPVKVTYSVAT